MAADPPRPSSKQGALEAAGRELREAQRTDQNELLAAQQSLRRAQHARDRAVDDARRRLRAAHQAKLGSATVEAAHNALVAAQRDRHGVEEALPLLRRLADVVEDDEEVLDMAPAVCGGHDGVVVATDRRILFLALRRTLSQSYRQIASVNVKGRHLRARLIVATCDDKLVIGGLKPPRAAALAELISQRQQWR
jgi:hypothetical protein